MTIKEKVAVESISRIEKRLEEIDNILNASPLLDILKLDEEVSVTVKKMKVGSKEILEYLESKINQRKELLLLAGKQQKTLELIDEKVKLEGERVGLENELFRLRR